MSRFLTALGGPLKGRGVILPSAAEIVEVRENAAGDITLVPAPISKLGKVIGQYRPGPDGAVWEEK